MDSVTERLEKFVRDGVFGDGKLLRILEASSAGKGAQYQSDLGFFEIDLMSEGNINKVPVVVKIQVGEEERRKSSYASNQFLNEVTMYETILPKLGGDKLKISPKMFLGIATAGEHPNADIIVLDDLRPKGFKVAEDIFLDYDHVMLTMKKLGEFHGLSYSMKKSSDVNFQELVDRLVPVQIPSVEGMYEACMLRGFQPLLENSPNYSVVNRAYKKLSKRIVVDLVAALRAPEDPFAVILHGDFNKNNILYAYDENEKVVSMVMLDFAFAKYGDPAIDISFFLYLNTSNALRDRHWAEFIKSYWDGLTSVTADPGFTFAEFENNFAKKAIYGYVISSFYLPTLLSSETVITNEFFSMTSEEMVQVMVSAGGKEGTDAISAIVTHLLDAGYLEKYLIHF